MAYEELGNISLEEQALIGKYALEGKSEPDITRDIQMKRLSELRIPNINMPTKIGDTTIGNAPLNKEMLSGLIDMVPGASQNTLTKFPDVTYSNFDIEKNKQIQTKPESKKSTEGKPEKKSTEGKNSENNIGKDNKLPTPKVTIPLPDWLKASMMKQEMPFTNNRNIRNTMANNVGANIAITGLNALYNMREGLPLDDLARARAVSQMNLLEREMTPQEAAQAKLLQDAKQREINSNILKDALIQSQIDKNKQGKAPAKERTYTQTIYEYGPDGKVIRSYTVPVGTTASDNKSEADKTKTNFSTGFQAAIDKKK